MPANFCFLLVEPGISSPGVPPAGGVGAVVELVAGLPAPTWMVGHGEGGVRPKDLAGGDPIRSESTTSVGQQKM